MLCYIAFGGVLKRETGVFTVKKGMGGRKRDIHVSQLLFLHLGCEMRLRFGHGGGSSWFGYDTLLLRL